MFEACTLRRMMTKEQISERNRAYYYSHKEKVLAKQAEYRARVRPIRNAKKRIYNHAVYPRLRIRLGMRPKAEYLAIVRVDPAVKTRRKYLYAQIHNLLKKGLSHSRPHKYIGLTCHQLRAHLEAQFTPEMSWQNYGSYWEVDHIKPLTAFNLLDPQEFAACSHYSNLRPLTSVQNRKRIVMRPYPRPINRG